MTSPEVPVVPPTDSTEATWERPGLRLFLWYSIGGSLPARYNTWVLHDVTCRTWWVRHFARVFALITPPLVAFYLLFVPTFGAPAAYAGICLAGTLFLAGMIYILIDSDRRAVRAGYPPDYAARLRSRRASETQNSSNYQRRERIAARRDRRYNKR
jgi:hypothetical protein